MRKPSIKFQRAMKQAVGERDFMAGIERDMELANDVRQMLESKGGAALFNAFEEIERGCYAELTNTSPFRVHKQVQIRAELMTVQFIKAKMSTYISNAKTLQTYIDEINGQEEVVLDD